MDMARQNPDTVVVGEIRTSEAMEAVLIMAESGLKVFTTVHATSVVETIRRMVNFFPSADHDRVYDRIGATVTGIVNQWLAPAKGGRGRVLVCELLSCHEGSPAHRPLREGKVQNIKTIIEQADKQVRSLEETEICSKQKYMGLLKEIGKI